MGLKRYENLAQIYEKEGGMGRADDELVDVGKVDPNYDPKFTINVSKYLSGQLRSAKLG